MREDPLWNELPLGLSFWEIENAMPEWAQGASLRKTPDDLKIVAVIRDDEQEITATTAVPAAPKEKRKGPTPSVLKQVMGHIDETFPLYTAKFGKHMEVAVKEQLQDVVTNGPISKLLGPKRCREILSYVSSPMTHVQISFLELWSFLLQRPIRVSENTIAWNVLPATDEEPPVPITIITKN